MPTREELAEAGPRVPDYYRIGAGDLMAMFDEIGWGEGFNRACAVKYLVRAGRKPGVPALRDMTKALRCVVREIRRLGGDVPADL